MYKKFIKSVCLAGMIFMFSCSNPDESVLDPDEKIQLQRIENDSLMIIFDSIININISMPQLIDSLIVSKKCLTQFNALARETKGELTVVANSKYVSQEIIKIIKNNVSDNTDIMMIIDKTSSMVDDLENIQKGLSQILSSLEGFNNVRLAVSTYGDKNIDGDLWYDFKNFETDFSETKNFIQNIQMTHGGDFPESVYDGIYSAFQENFWLSDSKKIVILLGDAPSLDSTLTTYNETDIIQLATREKIAMNFYPIVLSPFNGEIGETKKMQKLPFISHIYPNPCRGPFAIKLNKTGEFTVEIINQKGKVIQSETIRTDSYKSDLYDFPNGLYIIRVYDKDKNFDTQKIILNK